MISLLSPAKSLDLNPVDINDHTLPRLLYDTGRLADVLKKKSVRSLGKLMSINENLSVLNVQRYQAYHEEHTAENSKQAVLAFNGDVYRGLNAAAFSKSELEFAQSHLRILSGFYGLLRPLDYIQPYRLEMGTKLNTSRGKTLYKFWGDRITKLLNEDLKASGTPAIINVASNEYFKAVNLKKLEAPVINIQFKEYRDGELKFLSFNAKRARGLMARYIISNQIDSVEEVKGFNLEGYGIDLERSTEDSFLFTRISA